MASPPCHARTLPGLVMVAAVRFAIIVDGFRVLEDEPGLQHPHGRLQGQEKAVDAGHLPFIGLDHEGVELGRVGTIAPSS